MAGLNKVMVIGRLGRDPEIKYSGQGTAIVKMAVATSETWNDKNTGQKQEKTEWHRITVFGKQGENCEKFLSKGSQVYVEGKLQTSSYDKEGQTHYSTDIIANAVQFLDSKTKDQPGGYQPPQQNQAPPQNQGYQQQAQPQNQGYQPQPPNGQEMGYDNSEILF